MGSLELHLKSSTHTSGLRSFQIRRSMPNDYPGTLPKWRVWYLFTAASIAGQIEYWAKLGQMIEDNPDLPLPFIQEILVGREQIKSGQGTPYIFGEGE
jgi:hypothetical protein